jgi:hypothetical protein
MSGIGVAKDFEVLDAPRRIIALDEDAFMDDPQFMDDDGLDSEWEEIEEFDLDFGGPSQGQDPDYLLARRLQDEEDAIYAQMRQGSRTRVVSEARRKAYADVLRDDFAAVEGLLCRPSVSSSQCL